jgi:AraC family transcriptional regulator
VASGHHGFRAWLYDLVSGRGEEEADGVDRALVWLRKNLNRRLILDDLASEADMDRYVFCRRFKTRTGLSPLAYVHRSKVEAASFLLSATELSLAEVAQRFGFSDEFHFGKVFRKWRGDSPGRWRKLNSEYSSP